MKYTTQIFALSALAAKTTLASSFQEMIDARDMREDPNDQN